MYSNTLRRPEIIRFVQTTKRVLTCFHFLFQPADGNTVSARHIDTMHTRLMGFAKTRTARGD